MDKTFLSGLGLTIVSIFLPYTVKDIPPILGWLGFAIGATLIIISGLMWLCSRNKHSTVESQSIAKLKVVLLPAHGQLRLHNNGEEEIYLWGNKFANTQPIIEIQSRRIPSRHFYYFLTDEIVKNARQIIGENGQQLVPFEVYLTNSANKRFIATFNLLFIIKNNVVEIHTQQLDIQDQDWNTNA